MHLTECDNLLTEILDRAADEVDGVVDYQEPVMHIRAMPYFYSWILGVMSAQVIAYLGMAWGCIDCRRNSCLTFCQNLQYLFIHVVVNYNHPLFGFSD